MAANSVSSESETPDNSDRVRNSVGAVEEMLVDTTPVASDKEDEMRIGSNSDGTAARTEEPVQLDALMQGINLEKMEHRAQRFGVEVPPSVKSVSELELKMLYKSLDIDLKDSSAMARCGKIRLDTVHMRGVNEMSTEDVFDYFKGYGPATVEWINDHSCNILWTETVSPARALVVLSQPIKRSPQPTSERTDPDGAAATSSEIEEGEDVEMSDHDTTSHFRHCSSSSVESDIRQRSRQNSAEQTNTFAPNNSPVDVGQTETDSDAEITSTAIDASTIEIPVPPGPWRLGVPHPKAKSLLLRYAFKSDRKILGAEKLSQYYIRYGNPNYQGLKGIISTSLKRKIKEVHHRPGGYIDLDAVGDDDDNDIKDVAPVYDLCTKQKELPKRPRMRMYADDEEQKVKKSSVLSVQLQQSNLGRGDLRNRIGCEKFTFAASVTMAAGDQRSDGPDLRTRLSSTRRSSSTDGGGSARDLSRPSVIGDLRSKLEKLRQSRQPKVPLFIEIAHDDI